MDTVAGIPTLQIRTLKFRNVKKFVQSHKTGYYKYYEQHPDHVKPELPPQHTIQNCLFLYLCVSERVGMTLGGHLV